MTLQFYSSDRIRDTLVHEMCHAATWIVDGIKGGGHGNQWRAWYMRMNCTMLKLSEQSEPGFSHQIITGQRRQMKCTQT